MPTEDIRELNEILKIQNSTLKHVITIFNRIKDLEDRVAKIEDILNERIERENNE